MNLNLNDSIVMVAGGCNEGSSGFWDSTDLLGKSFFFFFPFWCSFFLMYVLFSMKGTNAS